MASPYRAPPTRGRRRRARTSAFHTEAGRPRQTRGREPKRLAGRSGIDGLSCGREPFEANCHRSSQRCVATDALVGGSRPPTADYPGWVPHGFPTRPNSPLSGPTEIISTPLNRTKIPANLLLVVERHGLQAGKQRIRIPRQEHCGGIQTLIRPIIDDAMDLGASHVPNVAIPSGRPAPECPHSPATATRYLGAAGVAMCVQCAYTDRVAEAKTHRVQLRVAPSDDALLRRAASLRDESLSEFLVESGRERAERLLADRTEFVVSDAQWQAFAAALDRPAVIRPELVELFARPRPE